MTKAKYYIYRNLHTGGFSIKHRGIVILRSHNIIASNVTFKVNELGRQKVIKEKCKNVHAYVVCESFTTEIPNKINHDNIITYNPYVNESFVLNDIPIFMTDAVLLMNGKCYLQNY